MPDFGDEVAGLLQGAVNPISNIVTALSTGNLSQALLDIGGAGATVAGLPAGDATAAAAGVPEAGAAAPLTPVSVEALAPPAGLVTTPSDLTSAVNTAVAAGGGTAADVATVPISDAAAAAGGALPGAGPTATFAGNLPADLAPAAAPAGAAVPAGASAASAAPTVGEKILESLGLGPQSAGFIGRNIGPIAAGGGLLYNIAGQGSIPGAGNLKRQAETLAGQGAQLQSYVNTGKLPPGAQAAVDLATRSAKQAMISQYAGRGEDVSQNPDGSYKNAALQQDLNTISMQAVSTAFQIADQLLNSGISLSDLSAQIYETLVNANERQAEQTGAAIANFAAALGGSGPGGPGRRITINT